MRADDDIVKDILDRVRQIMGPSFDGDVAVKLEGEIRHDWGGDRYYIPYGKSSIFERNGLIIEIWEKGEIGAKSLAERFGMSERQIRRIVKA